MSLVRDLRIREQLDPNFKRPGTPLDKDEGVKTKLATAALAGSMMAHEPDSVNLPPPKDTVAVQTVDRMAQSIVDPLENQVEWKKFVNRKNGSVTFKLSQIINPNILAIRP